MTITHYGGEGNVSDGIAILRIPDPLNPGQLIEAPDRTALMIRNAATLEAVTTGLIDPVDGPTTEIKSLPYGLVRIAIDGGPPSIDASGDGGANWTRLYSMELWRLLLAEPAAAAAQSIQVVTAGRVPREFIQPTQPTAVQGAVAGDFWTKYP